MAAERARRGLHAVVAASRLVPARDQRPAMVHVVVPPKAARPLVARLGPDRAVAVVVAGILLGASVVSVYAGQPGPSTGGPTGDGPAPRIAVGGGTGSTQDESTGTGNVAFALPEPANTPQSRFAAIDLGDTTIAAGETVGVEGPFIEDGTLVKPIAVDTFVADGSALLKTYTVKGGDTLVDIASRFGVSMMSVWWANNLKSKDDLHLGEVLRIPPVTGLIVTVSATDTLDSLAARYNVENADILATNGLDDPNLVVGQVLVVPGAKGQAIAPHAPIAKTPTRPAAKAPVRISSGSGPSTRPPATYSGGKMTWPVVGGGNYISQYFHYGHYGVDIAADYGSTVRAASAGTVTFAGWKSNGGGYQVWISHGSGLYTTYNHMSGVSVGRGQHVGRGQQVGRVGQSGNATGPHLHFEVWRGAVWDGGQRINPLGYF